MIMLGLLPDISICKSLTFGIVYRQNIALIEWSLMVFEVFECVKQEVRVAFNTRQLSITCGMKPFKFYKTSHLNIPIKRIMRCEGKILRKNNKKSLKIPKGNQK